MKTIAALALLALADLAQAAPAVHHKSGPDAKGLSTFWVKCENGNVSTTVCLKDVSHCGAEHQLSLMTAATLACDSIVGLVMERGK